MALDEPVFEGKPFSDPEPITRRIRGDQIEPRTVDASRLEASLPRGFLAEQRSGTATTGVNAAAGETDLIDTSQSVTIIAGRKYRMSLSVPVQSSAVPTNCIIKMYEDATLILEARTNFATAASAGITTMTTLTTRSPSDGPHTYKLTMTTDQGAGTLQTNQNTTRSTFWLIEDIGAA